MATDTTAPPRSGFFAKLKERLNRGKSWITGEIGGILARKLDETTLEDLEEQLVLADVGIEATNWVIDDLRKRARGSSADANELLRETVCSLLGPLAQPLEIDATKRPFVILFVGVNGTGKTTSIGKLASRLRQRGLSVLLAAGDTFRAAAVEQLQAWGERAGVSVVAQASGADPAAVVHDALHAARARDIDVVIADTAGRLHTAAGLMDELQKVKRVIGRFDPTAPHEVMLVLDASQGQNALAQAREFHAKLGVTGLILTKLDGTAKGGIALAIARAVPVPIRFIAVGEGVNDFGEFDAEEFATALTGASAP